MSAPLSHPLRVRYGECDPQGVVFNAHYLAWFDIALTELWRAALGSYDAMVARGVDVVVAEAVVRYRRPARFDDELELRIAISRLGTSSIISDHEVRRAEVTIAHGQTRHVCVETPGLAKTAIPDWLRESLQPWLVPA